MKSKLNIDYALYLVTDRDILGERDLITSVEEAIQGGVSVVQLREKDSLTRDFYTTAEKIKNITDKYNIPLIINDRLDIALAIDAAGVHVGQKDMPAHIVRKLLGKDKILGVSVATIEEALKAQREGADYLGVGAIFPTCSKKDTRKVTLDLLEQIKNTVNIPIVAIGGINHDNVIPIMQKRIAGVAVISAILGKDDIKQASQDFYKIIKDVIDTKE